MEKKIEESWNCYRLGDNQALSLIYLEFHFRLIHRALTILKDEEKSKDAVNSLFLKFFEYSLSDRKFLPMGAEFDIEAYFFRSIQNKCFDIIKNEKRRREILKGIGDGIKHLFTRYTHEDSFVEANFLKLIDVLPERQKEILKMHLDGFQNEEIAENLNLSYNTVRNTLSTSKAKIRSLWSVYMD